MNYGATSRATGSPAQPCSAATQVAQHPQHRFVRCRYWQWHILPCESQSMRQAEHVGYPSSNGNSNAGRLNYSRLQKFDQFAHYMEEEGQCLLQLPR